MSNKNINITCIYCLQHKLAKEFNKEHLLHQAFGRYNNNLTLINMVCETCNKKFGDTIDLEFARNTWEGTHRFTIHLKPPNEFNPRKYSKNTRYIVREGIMNGLPVTLTCRKRTNGKDSICITPEFDVGFRVSENSYEFYQIENIPAKEIAESKYPFHLERILVLPHRDPEIVINAISKKWAVPTNEVQYVVCVEDDKDLLTEVNIEYNELVRRAYTKIAFNYLACINSADVALQNIFNPIRDFILSGKQIRLGCVSITNEPILKGEKRDIHIIAIEKFNDSIICRISIFNRRQMIITLAHNYTGLPIKTCGHHFNPHTKHIGLIGKSSLYLDRSYPLIYKTGSLLIPVPNNLFII